MTARTICLHGPESVGKSVLAAQLGERLGGEVVGEYGRDYCLEHGTDSTMADLLAIAREQQARIAAARVRAGTAGWVIADTDALMTAVWADMLHGTRDPWFDAFRDCADLYLLLDIDLPFVDDGLRVYGGSGERARFFALCQGELERRGVRWALVQGTGAARLANALTAIARAFGRAALAPPG
jgi:NadR type nicotinamide-nucleotide adenylyltransferase